MVKVILIDDEQHCIDTLTSMLKLHPNFTIVGTAQTVSEAIEKTKRLKPNLVFLDIEMGNANGFDYLQAFSSIDFYVIFTTAHEGYAIRAIKFSALDYLLKPIDQDELKQSLNKLDDKLSSEGIEERINTLIHNLRQPETSKRIHIKTAVGFEFIEIKQILFLKGAINYTDIYLTIGKKITVTKTLKFFESLLSQTQFYRIHKSFIINISHIIAYHKTNGGEVIMKDKTTISVSIRRREHFLKTVFPNS